MENNIELLRHLKTLSKQYNNIGQVTEEIINLKQFLIYQRDRLFK